MYLFPGEEAMYPAGGPWYTIMESEGGVEHFTGNKPLILNCRGRCHREKRPLACRLFPLAPYLDPEGNLNIVLDDDALLMCPLVRQGEPEAIDPDFREAVRRVWVDLLQDSSVRDTVRGYSARIDRQSSDPWRLFFKT
ncbi:MAG: hypothetical protein ACOY30_12820 [Bacillota bacterium]